MTIALQQARGRAHDYLKKAGIVLRPDEAAEIEIVDFGLDDLENYGIQLITYVNTERVCAKELVMFPRQTCAEHIHPPVAGEPGKEETFRCRWGTLYLYVEGEPVDPDDALATPPAGHEHGFNVFHQIVLQPGDQYTLAPNTWHWFQGGDEGAVVSEFSTKSRDESDLFADPDVDRTPMG